MSQFSFAPTLNNRTTLYGGLRLRPTTGGRAAADIHMVGFRVVKPTGTAV